MGRLMWTLLVSQYLLMQTYIVCLSAATVKRKICSSPPELFLFIFFYLFLSDLSPVFGFDLGVDT